MIQFAYGVTIAKRPNVKPAFRKWGPFYLIIFAMVASMVDLTKQVIIDSETQILKPMHGGDAKSFDFAHCSYTAVAAPLPGLSVQACSVDPVAVQQIGPLTDKTLKWLEGDTVKQICSWLGWASLVFTIVGFMWLSEVLLWLQQHWDRCQGKEVDEPLLGCQARDA